jgi:hypothetical protein
MFSTNTINKKSRDNSYCMWLRSLIFTNRQILRAERGTVHDAHRILIWSENDPGLYWTVVRHLRLL